jgi:hypothetical protein
MQQVSHPEFVPPMLVGSVCRSDVTNMVIEVLARKI